MHSLRIGFRLRKWVCRDRIAQLPRVQDEHLRQKSVSFQYQIADTLGQRDRRALRFLKHDVSALNVGADSAEPRAFEKHRQILHRQYLAAADIDTAKQCYPDRHLATLSPPLR